MKLPIGIQSFVALRGEPHYYVDKSRYVRMLVDQGKYFFLSRPRRFGKSLFLDTLRQAFLCRRDLFQGLYLEEHWDWDSPHPVVHVSFGSGVLHRPGDLCETLRSIVDRHARDASIELGENLVNRRFEELIRGLHEQAGRPVVVLIDEYDKPILDNIEHPETAAAMREELKNFYAVLKDADEHLRLVFITGVSKFSKVSLFSGLNNLQDLTLHPGCATLCGYTQAELEEVFADRLQGVDLDEVRLWYNGYSWGGERVYNPFDVLLFLDSGQFKAHWFETGTPTFLIRLLMEGRYHIPRLEALEASERIIGSFDIEHIEVETLLFQTGYLTILETRRMAGRQSYLLGYPNLEVRMSLTDYILDFQVRDITRKEKNIIQVYKALEQRDMEGLRRVFDAFFSSIPHDWYRKNTLARYEGYHASIFYCYFTALGLDVCVEEAVSHGRLDMAVLLDGHAFIFEFKVVELEPRGAALAQLLERGYHEKYLNRCAGITLCGVEFSSERRGIVAFECEEIAGATGVAETEDSPAGRA